MIIPLYPYNTIFAGGLFAGKNASYIIIEEITFVVSLLLLPFASFRRAFGSLSRVSWSHLTATTDLILL